MSEQIEAPWTPDQVKSLNEYQQSGKFHPFTCSCGYGSHALVAHKAGWTCPVCSKEGRAYTQNWCWDWMANWTW